MGITILVDSKIIFVNRQDPTQFSYEEMESPETENPQWIVVTLHIHTNGLPTPGQDEILYQLRGSNVRGAMLNVNNM